MAKHAYRYKKNHPAVDSPPFTTFATFIQELSLERNNPNLVIDTVERDTGVRNRPREANTNKTEVDTDDTGETTPCDPSNWCLIHQKPYPLRKCRVFLAKALGERTKIVKENGVCFRCIASREHVAKDCKANIVCSECGSVKHLAPLHAVTHPKNGGGPLQGPGKPTGKNQEEITTKYTELCGNTLGGKSCSKICLANVYLRGHPENKLKAYVVIDDQSNSSLAKPELFDALNIHGQTTTYRLKTCAGSNIRRKEEIVGRYASSPASWNVTTYQIQGKRYQPQR
jgi:hypothetical protein